MGVILDIAAWNYPLLIAVNIVIASILAGNSVIIKHSSRTPLCGKIFEDAFKSFQYELIQIANKKCQKTLTEAFDVRKEINESKYNSI